MRSMIQDEHRACGNPEVELSVIDASLREEVQRAVEYAGVRTGKGHGAAFERLAQMVRQIEKRIHSTPDAFVEECPFEGYVEVATEAGAAVWTCPVCDDEHREEPE